jgi:hypothetical protein
MNPIDHKFTSINGKYYIQIVGFDEPNNGRELWEVKVFNESKDITSLLTSSRGFINFNTDQFQIDTNDSEFVYIPFEGVPKLIQTNDFTIIDLPYQPLSTVRFIGNKFERNHLMEIYRDVIVLTNLQTLNSNTIKINDISTIEWAEFVNEQTLSVEYAYFELKDNQRMRKIKKRFITLYK